VPCLRFVRQPEKGQHHTSKAHAEFLESCTASHRLGQLFRQFIEFVVFSFGLPLGLAGLYFAFVNNNPLAIPAATVRISLAAKSDWKASGLCIPLVSQPETGQRHPCETDAEFLECPTARYRLGHLFR
jgi:hypothetical protein